MSPPEVWLRGPVPGVPALLQPVVHALKQVEEEVTRSLETVDEAGLRIEPGGAASIACHCRHLAGATDRLLTYARGESLSPEQLSALRAEASAAATPVTAGELVRLVRQAVATAIAQVTRTPVETLAEERQVGRARLPSTVGGLLFHAAEHAARHAGQIATTARIVRGQRAGPRAGAPPG
jgi:uncharacterized damage-inducible protein DinB